MSSASWFARRWSTFVVDSHSHPTAAGRVYAAYGGVYIGVAILWLWAVDGIRPTTTDWVGLVVSLFGMAIIMFGPRPSQ
jgi:small multidrug resistance family-3 protein